MYTFYYILACSTSKTKFPIHALNSSSCVHCKLIILCLHTCNFEMLKFLCEEVVYSVFFPCHLSSSRLTACVRPLTGTWLTSSNTSSRWICWQDIAGPRGKTFLMRITPCDLSSVSTSTPPYTLKPRPDDPLFRSTENVLSTKVEHIYNHRM